MRIALLTLHAPANYGSNLQAFAMVRMLESYGHEVELLDYRPEDDERYYDQVTPPRQREAHEAFLRDFLPMSPRLTTISDVSERVQSTGPDGVVVGSDAVLRVAPGPRQREVNRFGNAFWLEWLEERASGVTPPSAFFAASCMGSAYATLPSETRRGILRCLSGRTYVSVRDLWTKWMLEALAPESSLGVRLSPDPVFSLSDLADNAETVLGRLRVPDRYIVISFMKRCWPHPEWVRQFKELARRQGLRIVELPDPDGGVTFKEVDWTPPAALSPFEWLSVIARAHGYVGTRFHAIVVALMCGVPFVAVDTYGESVREGSTGNFPSKTFDLCLRAGFAGQVVSSANLPSTPPERVLALLATARDGAWAVEDLQRRLRLEAEAMLDSFSVG